MPEGMEALSAAGSNRRYFRLRGGGRVRRRRGGHVRGGEPRLHRHGTALPPGRAARAAGAGPQRGRHVLPARGLGRHHAVRPPGRRPPHRHVWRGRKPPCCAAPCNACPRCRSWGARLRLLGVLPVGGVQHALGDVGLELFQILLPQGHRVWSFRKTAWKTTSNGWPPCCCGRTATRSCTATSKAAT